MPKVLVANRGEIAIRILRSAGELGWTTVAVYTEDDESHATFADEAVKLDKVSDFLDVDRIVGITTRTGCTHLHPGYGFLSESPALALALPDSIIFVGPSPETLRIASDKLLSRDLATSLDVRTAAGTRVLSSDDIRVFGGVEGYPVIIKALDGGGGRGIRLVEAEPDVEEAFNRCLGESPSRQIFAEKALTGPSWKHIEMQIIGDGTGDADHLFERECSVQRRFQKVIEVAPSRLPSKVLNLLSHSSVKMARHLRYRGLGTFEYLVNAQTLEWVFLEINPRMQVEHTITEEITGIDLVRAQLLLFTPSATLASLALPIPFTHKGYAIQLRLTAEDPSRSFSLSPGTVKATGVVWPSGRGVRIDTWLSTGPSLSEPLTEWTVGTEFDSLLAKIIIRGDNIEEVTQKATRALREVKFRGPVKTNSVVLAGVLNHPDWMSGNIDTLWLERNVEEIIAIGKAILEPQRPPNGFEKMSRPHNNRDASTAPGGILLQPGSLFHLSLSTINAITNLPELKHTLMLSSIAHNEFPDKLSGTLQTSLSPGPLSFSLSQSTSATVASSMFELADPNNPSHVISPFTGKIVELHSALSPVKETGAVSEDCRYIKKGETIVTLSVMKMENVITARGDATVVRLGKGIQVGAVLGEGMLVCVLGNTEHLTSRL